MFWHIGATFKSLRKEQFSVPKKDPRGLKGLFYVVVDEGMAVKYYTLLQMSHFKFL